METYIYEVNLRVEVEAFDDADAWELIQDTFGVGDTSGVTVTDCEFQEVKK